MDPRETELVEEVVAQVRAAVRAAARPWRRVRVQFELLDGCFSTRVSFGGVGALEPLDAMAHRQLFVRLQAMGRRLCGGAGPQAWCEVHIDADGHRTVRSAART